MSKVKILSVAEHGGVAWKLGEQTPGAKPGENEIVEMFQLDDRSIEVYVRPLPGTPNSNLLIEKKAALIFTIMPMTIRMVMAFASTQEWYRLIVETNESMDAEDDEEDENEGEPPVVAPQTSPSPQPAQQNSFMPATLPSLTPNGSGTPSS